MAYAVAQEVVPLEAFAAAVTVELLAVAAFSFAASGVGPLQNGEKSESHELNQMA